MTTLHGGSAKSLETAAPLLRRWEIAFILLPLIAWSRNFSFPAPFCPTQVHTRMPRPAGHQGPFPPVWHGLRATGARGQDGEWGRHHGADGKHPATAALWGREAARLLPSN